MNKISKSKTKPNLRYDGYYLWLGVEFTSEWLQFTPNGIVGQNYCRKGTILGVNYNNEPVSRSHFYQLIHKYIMEKFPRSKDPEELPHYHKGKYNIYGNKINFKIMQYDLDLKYRGRILKDSLDLLRFMAAPQIQDEISETVMYEFVAFEF